MWKWLRTNSEVFHALGAGATALAALAALIIIPLQIAAAEQIQLRQTARDMYRGFIAISIERPALANAEFCALKSADEQTAYEAYIEYMLYTTEQLMATNPQDWRGPMLGLMEDHRDFFCSITDWNGHDDAILEMIAEVRAACPAVPACAAPADLQ